MEKEVRYAVYIVLFMATAALIVVGPPLAALVPLFLLALTDMVVID